MSAEEVANAFVSHYYTASPDNLAGLFTANSMMTFEGNQIQGPENIVNKFKSFGQVSYSTKTVDVQPSVNDNAILIFVTGACQIGGDNPLHFSQVFQLVSNAPGSYHVHNTFFRLNYGL